MMVQLQAQAQRFGTDVRDGWVTKVDFSGPIHKVWVNDTKEIHAKQLSYLLEHQLNIWDYLQSNIIFKMGGGVLNVLYVMVFL